MIISDITEISNKKCKIFIDHEFAFVLYKGELRKNNIKLNSEISDETYSHILNEVLMKRCKMRAMNLLIARPYTEMKLREKLKLGLYPDACIEHAIEYVKGFGYVNDEQYARDYMFYHFQKDNRNQILRKLRMKGISEDIIKSVYDEFCEEEQKPDEVEMIYKILQKKHYEGYRASDDKTRVKMMRHLLSKGFQYEDVLKAIKEYA